MPRLDTSVVDDDTEFDISNPDNDRLVSECVQYMLLSDHKKLPIRRADMFKTVFKDVARTRNTNLAIIKYVKEKLAQKYSVKMIENDGDANSFILINKLPLNSMAKRELEKYKTDDYHLTTSILMPVLSVIFMSGGSISDGEMWKFLNKLKLTDKQTIKVPTGETVTIKKLMTELWPRQLYLKYKKITRGESPQYEFSWGFRAQMEFSKMDMLKFVCDMYGHETQPQYWRLQYEVAVKEQKEILEQDGDEDEVMQVDSVVNGHAEENRNGHAEENRNGRVTRSRTSGGRRNTNGHVEVELE